MSTQAVGAAQPTYVARLRSVLWPNLAALLVSSAGVSAAAAVVLLLTPALTPVALVLWAALVAPVFGGLVAQANDMILGSPVGAFSIAGYIGRVGRLSLTLWLPAAAPAACALVALEVWEQTRNPLALGSATVGAICAALLAVAAVTALPIALEVPTLRGIPLTVTALHVAARRPVPVFAVAAFLVGAVSASAHVAASIMFLVPGPLALVLVVAVWTSAAATGLQPRDREP